MPRKHREIRASLTAKGFEEKPKGDHVYLYYRTEAGELTTIQTKLSHASGGHDVSDSLLAPMARQVGLSKQDLLRLIDCPMNRLEFEQRTVKLAR